MPVNSGVSAVLQRLLKTSLVWCVCVLFTLH